MLDILYNNHNKKSNISLAIFYEIYFDRKRYTLGRVHITTKCSVWRRV